MITITRALLRATSKATPNRATLLVLNTPSRPMALHKAVRDTTSNLHRWHTNNNSDQVEVAAAAAA